MARRPYGSGSVYPRAEKDGSESWYGRWYPSSGGGQVHRKIGPKRKPGSREGLTKAQAERELDRRVEADAISHDDPVDVKPTLRDPKDDYLLALGRQAGAEGIVTGDRDLLDHKEPLDPPPLNLRDACESLGLID